jgi:Domain of unknown function (DUF5668)
MADATYYRSRHCPCARCRCRGLMGAAVLITLGVLFLLQEFWIIRFDQSWPVLLLVIGGMMLLSRTASAEGHAQPYWIGGPGAPGTTPVQGDPWAGGSPGGSSVAGGQRSSPASGSSSSATSGSAEPEVHS